MQISLTRRPDYKVTPGSLGDVHLALHLIIVIVISFQLEIVGVTKIEKKLDLWHRSFRSVSLADAGHFTSNKPRGSAMLGSYTNPSGDAPSQQSYKTVSIHNIIIICIN